MNLRGTSRGCRSVADPALSLRLPLPVVCGSTGADEHPASRRDPGLRRTAGARARSLPSAARVGPCDHNGHGQARPSGPTLDSAPPRRRSSAVRSTGWSRRRRSDRARPGSPPAPSSWSSPTVSGFRGFLSNRRAPGSHRTDVSRNMSRTRRFSPALTKLETDALNCAYLRHPACKMATFNPKVVGSNPTGGIEK
jgi:hypothetical protein